MDDFKGPESTEILSSDALSLRDQRSLMFHLLYAVESFDYETSLEAIVDNFGRGFGISVARDSDLYKQVAAVIEQREHLDKLYQPLLANWRFDRLGTATRLILRNALWELEHTTADRALIINEAVELAKCFAEKDAYKFVNGILDEFIKQEKTS
jgi:transcription antitermination protein NusB